MHSCQTMKALNAPKKKTTKAEALASYGYKPAKKKRVFYKTTVTVTVLSEDAPVDENWDLKDIEHEMSHGNLVGDVEISKQKKLTPKQVAKELYKVGSQPEFFDIDDNGKDTSEQEDPAT